jgi:hypothetical protein
MGDPLRDADVAVDAEPADLDAAAPRPEREAWLLKSSPPRWQVWRERNGHRPPTRAEKRGRVAASLAAPIFAVLTFGGLISYGIQWQGLLRDATDQISMRDTARIASSEVNSGADIQVAVDRAQGANSESAGLVGIVDGQVAATTPKVVRAAADQGFVKEAMKQAEDFRVGAQSASGYGVNPGTHMSWESVCVYQSTPITWNDPADGSNVVVVNVFDLTPTRDRLNGKYLLYELGSLAGAGVAAAAVWWRLGKRKRSADEPDEV